MLITISGRFNQPVWLNKDGNLARRCVFSYVDVYAFINSVEGEP